MTSLQVHTGRQIATRISRKERDFLLLNVFVLTQHGYIDRARVLADALHLMGERSSEVLLARALVRFLSGEWRQALTALEELDRADPLERFGNYKLTDRQRMRRYLKGRCLHELGERAGARDALDSYLRHGTAGIEEAE